MAKLAIKNSANAAVQNGIENFKLDPWWISGFADGEASFIV